MERLYGTGSRLGIDYHHPYHLETCPLKILGQSAPDHHSDSSYSPTILSRPLEEDHQIWSSFWY
ncbi:hypothetical protein [Zobellia uliginosa]|uniref:hypothetical protein n=1 Tax=Zobellia uliginosa TaxID=143224 RepID=UPI0026E1E5F8|nr:hypothetical protein [Zobellia uliginosa]MDO6519009.1 hypothetical protein [Zobellia uliginosa]